MVTLPGDIPVINPEELIEAIVALDDDQLPPGLDAVSKEVSPTQILLSPLITEPSC
jgi:hypothetical protein